MRSVLIRKFLGPLCLLCVSAGVASALDREAFTITKYDLNIRLEPEQQRLGARGKITLRNDSANPQKIVALQITSSLNWRSIRAGDKPLQFVSQPYVSDIDHTGGLSEALVTLPAEIKPKDSVELEIGYEGVIPLDATRLTRVGVPDAIARHTSWDQISPAFTAVRGAGYVAWYPITTVSADFSEGNSLFEVVARWKARAAGSEFKARIGMDREGDILPLAVCTAGSPSFNEAVGGLQRMSTGCAWEKLGTVTPTFVMARYDNWYQSPFTLLSLAGHERGAGKYSAAFDPAAKFVGDWFGKPSVPIAIADHADPNAAPFESGTLLLVSMAGEDTKFAGINLVHELVHSAFPSPRPWVYEGLAHFAEALYREQQGGRQAALDLLGIHRSAFVDLEKEVTSAPENVAPQPLANTFEETFFRSKAAYVWWMLRDMVGDAALKQALRNYRPADDTDPKYVERLVEAASGRDLAWFFDDWVYHDRGLPDLRVLAAHPWKPDGEQPGKQTKMITVTIENRGLTSAEVPFTVRCLESDVTRRLEVRAKSTATLRVELVSAPIDVVVNDGSVPESDLKDNVFKIEAEGKQN